MEPLLLSVGSALTRTSADCQGDGVWGQRLLDFFFLGPNLWHMEVPRPGVELELQLPAYTTATATPDQNHVFDLHDSSRQCWIFNPLSEARGQTCVLMDTSWVH